MSDETVDLNNRTKAAMRQKETFLNKSGREVPRAYSPNNSNSGPTKPEQSLNFHGSPYRDRSADRK